jgi:hypothetical protein
MHLNLDGVNVRIVQLGPDFLILGGATEIRANRAEIAFRVDANERRWPVELPKGLAGPGERTPIVNRA